MSRRLRLVVTRALPDAVLAHIRANYDAVIHDSDTPFPADALVAAAQGADALFVTAMDKIDRALIARLPDSVKVIGTLSVGHEHIDKEAARQRGIAVLYTPDILSDAVAEMGMLLLLGAARRVREGDVLLRSGTWRGWSPTQLLGQDVTGRRLGIFGMGRIGRTLARQARGFLMEIHYHNRNRLAPDLEAGATYHPTFAGLLAVSDFLVLAAPATAETRRLLNRETISQLPPGAIVVNIARGDLVDDEALIEALRSGRLAAAGLDVFDGEPDLNPGYLALPNVFLQPHQGSSTLGTRTRMCELLLTSIDAVCAGAPVSNRLV